MRKWLTALVIAGIVAAPVSVANAAETMPGKAVGIGHSTSAAQPSTTSDELQYGCHDGPGGVFEGEYPSCSACQTQGLNYVHYKVADDYICVPISGTTRWSLGICGGTTNHPCRYARIETLENPATLGQKTNIA